MSPPPEPHCLACYATATADPEVLPYTSQREAVAAAKGVVRRLVLATGRGGRVELYPGSVPEGEPLRTWIAPPERDARGLRVDGSKSVTTCAPAEVLASFAALPGRPTMASAVLVGIAAAHEAAGVPMPVVTPKARAAGPRACGCAGFGRHKCGKVAAG